MIRYTMTTKTYTYTSSAGSLEYNLKVNSINNINQYTVNENETIYQRIPECINDDTFICPIFIYEKDISNKLFGQMYKY